MRTRGWTKLGGGLLGLALIAAACGGGDDKGGSASGGDKVLDAEQKKAAEEALKSTTTAATATTVAPKNIAEFEAAWKAQREVVIKKITDSKWGYDATAKKLTGPEGLVVDTSKCASGWSDTEGLSDTEIKIGHTTAQSGTLADYGNIARAMDVYFKYVNDNGGIKDSTGKTRKFNLVVKDDSYDAAKTIPLVDELIDSQKVFMMWTLGSPNTMKVYDKLNLRCIPNYFAMTGHPAWGDPLNHPWTQGHQLAYNTEAILWGGFIEKRFPQGAKVSALIMNNDFGKAYELGFKAFAAQSKVKIDFKFERIEPSAPTVTNEMTTLASQNPDVFIAMTAGTSCTQAITEAAQNGLKQSAKFLFQPSVCKGTNFVGKEKVGGDGSGADGWWVVGGGGIDINDAGKQTDPWVMWERETLTKAGLDPKASAQFGNGFAFAWPFVESVRVAAALPGGLTRTNLNLAVHYMDYNNPNLLPGIKYNTNGAKDAYPIEGSDFSTWDAKQQTWVPNAEIGIIELSGKSSPCAWDQSISNCK